MLSYPAAIPLSSRALNHLADLIRRHRRVRRSRWRRLEPGRQALLALAHLRNGDTFTRLAHGFEIGVSTAWRYVREAVDLLAATAEDLATAMNRIRVLAYAILDGILIPIDRVADQKPYYSGKTPPPRRQRAGHRRPRRPSPLGVGGTAQRRPRPHRRPRPRHHRRSQRHGRHDVRRQGLPRRGRRRPDPVQTPPLPAETHPQKQANRRHARIRARGERANTTLKTWKVLTKLRCCPRRATALVQAILALHHLENPTHTG